MIINEESVQKAKAHAVNSVVHHAKPQGQVKESGGAICNDLGGNFRPGCEFKGLIAGGSESIPFFASFLDNLGPQYWAADPDQRSVIASEISPACGKGQPQECQLDKTNGDGFRTPNGDGVKKVFQTFTATKPKLRHVMMTRDDDAPLRKSESPDSSRRGVQDLLSESPESDELISTYNPMMISFESTGDVLTDVLSPSNERAVRTPPADMDASGKENGVQSQCTLDRVSSAGSIPIDPPPHQSRMLSSRDLQGLQKELENDWHAPSSLGSKRLRLDMDPLVPLIAFPILPSQFSTPSFRDDSKKIRRRGFDEIEDDFDAIRRTIDAVQFKRARRRHLMRIRTLPDISIGKTNEAMDKTLIMLCHWHFILALDNPACPTVASHIFYRGFRRFQTYTWPIGFPQTKFRVRVLMAVAFWVTAKVMDSIRKVPRASQMASAANVTAQSLIHAEIPLLEALEWKLVRH